MRFLWVQIYSRNKAFCMKKHDIHAKNVKSITQNGIILNFTYFMSLWYSFKDFTPISPSLTISMALRTARAPARVVT